MKNVNVLNNGANKLEGLKLMVKEKREESIKSIIEFEVGTVVLSFKQMTASGNPDVGSTTNKNTNHIGLSFCPKFAKKALLKHFNLNEMTMGKDKYVGLVSRLAEKLPDQKQFCTDNKKVLITLINNDMVDDLILQMKNCDLDNEDNIKKIFWDLTVIYRMYQELIIDSAKKAYIVNILIALESYRALSLQKVYHVLNYGDEDEVAIDVEDHKDVLTKTSNKLIVYKNTPQKELNDGTVRKFFRDPISDIQKGLAQFLEEIVNIAADIKVEMPEEEVKRLLSYQGEGPVEDLVNTVKYAYRTLSIQYRENMKLIDVETQKDLHKRTKEEYKKAIDTLQILAKQLLDDYSPEDAASIMQLVAYLSKEGFNQESTNQIAINLLTDEFLTMLVNTSAEVKVMGYKLLINMGLNEGDEVEFINGVSDDLSVLDYKKEIEYASGLFRIEKFNGELYAVKDISFDIAKADYSKRVFCVKAGSFSDLEVVKDGLKEGSRVTVRRDGTIKSLDTLIAEVKFEAESGIQKLLGVTGVVSYLKIVETDNYAPMIMFELSEVEQLVSINDDVCMPEVEVDGIIEENFDEDGIEIEYENIDLNAEYDDGIDVEY